MNSKVVSFQIVQGVTPNQSGAGYYTPDVIALCEDGSMWFMGLNDFQDSYTPNWKRMTPEVAHSNSFMANRSLI